MVPVTPVSGRTYGFGVLLQLADANGLLVEAREFAEEFDIRKDREVTAPDSLSEPL